MSRYDVIVLGIGAVGSATAHELSRRGSKVLGLERFSVAHDRGSSHGDTRIIRLAYMEHPDYVPLLRRSYELWAQLEKERGEKLYHECGLLQVGPQGGHVIQGVLASARARPRS
ncbi:MAG: FAD-dependent oxidoreductase [Planctomycetota bacterium]